MNFWILILLCNLVVADNAFEEISVSLFAREVFATLFWFSNESAVCTNIGILPETSDPAIHDAICDNF